MCFFKILLLFSNCREDKSIDKDKLMLFRGQFTITLDRAREGTYYKYLVVKKGVVHYEELPEFPADQSAYVNRVLKIPDKHIISGGKWVIYSYITVRVATNIETDLYTKPTDKQPYLLITSCRPTHTKVCMEGHSGQKFNLIATCIPLDRIRVPLDRTFLPFDRTSIPLDRTFLPLDRTFIPLDRTFIPLDRTFLPFDRTSIILSLAI